MEYKELAKLYYSNGSSSRDADLARELDLRKSAPSSFRIGFASAHGDLFVAMPREMAVLNEKILKTERHVAKLMAGIPPIAQHAALRGLVLDEIVSTNTMEDVRSTPAQVKEALEAASGEDITKKRFRELARLYLDIVDSQQGIPQTPKDIRRIYDVAIAPEVAADKLPDGTVFRKEGVSITAGGVKVIHNGLEPEEKIIDAINRMFDLVHSEDIPELMSAVASHYLFEYAHPFYDGNGRTGRYLLSLFLSEILSKPTALSLSRTIAENAPTYYHAFKTAEHPLNKGELTFFVYDILMLIHLAQLGVIAGLEENTAKLKTAFEKFAIVAAEEKFDSHESEIVSMLVQYELFGIYGDVPLSAVARHLGVGEQMARKHVTKLEQRGMVEKRNLRKPITFALTEHGKAILGIRQDER